jgi:hypothetical protein
MDSTGVNYSGLSPQNQEAAKAALPIALALQRRVGRSGSMRRYGLADKSKMRALSIRQPYAELILRGPAVSRIKPIEFRSRPTKM